MERSLTSRAPNHEEGSSCSRSSATAASFSLWERLTEIEGLGLEDEAAAALQTERERWEGIQKYEQGESGTVVWVGAGGQPLASILGRKSVNWAGIDSHQQP